MVLAAVGRIGQSTARSPQLRQPRSTFSLARAERRTRPPRRLLLVAGTPSLRGHKHLAEHPAGQQPPHRSDHLWLNLFPPLLPADQHPGHAGHKRQLLEPGEEVAKEGDLHVLVPRVAEALGQPPQFLPPRLDAVGGEALGKELQPGPQPPRGHAGPMDELDVARLADALELAGQLLDLLAQIVRSERLKGGIDWGFIRSPAASVSDARRPSTPVILQRRQACTRHPPRQECRCWATCPQRVVGIGFPLLSPIGPGECLAGDARPFPPQAWQNEPPVPPPCSVT